jgi:DNA-directed RNA polymerase subunit N (RpoN/RPB10)
MGDKFNEFINRVYNSLDADTKAAVDKLAADDYDGNTLVAMEEYMASLAENENFKEQTIWEKIKTIFNNVINKILGRNDIKLGDNELRYLLRASYNNMVNPKGMQTLEGWAKDMMMRENYGINEVNASTPEILSRTGVDPTEVAATSARQVYDKVVSDNWNEFQRQFQDAYQPVRVAIDAIQAETGNIPIEDYENYLLAQNQSSSRSRVEIDNFQRKYYSPIIKQVNKIIDDIIVRFCFFFAIILSSTLSSILFTLLFSIICLLPCCHLLLVSLCFCFSFQL